MTKSKIGTIQFYLGIVLLVVTIVGCIVAMENVFDSFVNAVGDETETWGEISEKVVEGSAESELITGILVGDLITQGLVVRVAGVVFAACVLILLMLSVMLILQGLANRAKK